MFLLLLFFGPSFRGLTILFDVGVTFRDIYWIFLMISLLYGTQRSVYIPQSAIVFSAFDTNGVDNGINFTQLTAVCPCVIYRTDYSHIWVLCFQRKGSISSQLDKHFWKFRCISLRFLFMRVFQVSPRYLATVSYGIDWLFVVTEEHSPFWASFL